MFPLERAKLSGAFEKFFVLQKTPSLIWTKGAEMHTHFRAFSRKFFEKKFYPSLIWNWEVETHPVFTKNLKNILFDCGTAYFTYLKSPFTYLEFECQNATCFSEKTEKFLKNCLSQKYPLTYSHWERVFGDSNFEKKQKNLPTESGGQLCVYRK